MQELNGNWSGLEIRGKGKLAQQESFEERLARCDLELASVLKLGEEAYIGEIEWKNIRSIHLSKQLHFQSLINEIQVWNQDVQKIKNKTMLRPAKTTIRYALMKQLYMNLREVANTANRQSQICYLESVNDWYVRTKDLFVNVRPSTQDQKHKRNGGLQSNASFAQLELQTIEDFFVGHRSRNPELEPPEDRIKDYVKKEFNFLKSIVSPNQTRPNTVFQTQTSRPISQISGARPSTTQKSMRILTTVDFSSRGASRGGIYSSQSNQRDTILKDSRDQLRSPGLISPSSVSSPWNYTGSTGFFQERSQKDLSNFKLVKVDTAESSNGFDDPAEKNSETPKTIAIAPRQKVFTFDQVAVDSYTPIVRPTGDIKSTYLNYNPSNEPGEIRLENTWFKNRSSAVKAKREQEELEVHIREWASNRGLIDGELNRKNLLSSEGSKFIDIGVHKVDNNPVELTEQNCQPVEKSEEDKEQLQLFDGYLNVLKLDEVEKQKISAMVKTTSEFIGFDENEQEQVGQKNQLKTEDSKKIQDKLENKETDKDKENIEANNNNTVNNHEVLFQTGQQNIQKQLNYINLKEQVNNVLTNNQSSPKSKVSLSIIGLEDSMKRMRIQKLRESQKKIIGSIMTSNDEVLDDEEINRRKFTSLIVFNQTNSSNIEKNQQYHNESKSPEQVNNNGVHSKRNRKFRPLSSVLSMPQMSIAALQSDEFREIQKVRAAFAKKSIKCSLATITQSLSRPSSQPKFTVLPSPGSKLFSNPFNQFTKVKSAKGNSKSKIN